MGCIEIGFSLGLGRHLVPPIRIKGCEPMVTISPIEIQSVRRTAIIEFPD